MFNIRSNLPSAPQLAFQGKPFTGFVHDENGQPIPIDPELIEKIKRMKVDGVKPYQMAHILGISKSPMYRILAYLRLWKVKKRQEEKKTEEV